MSSISVTAHIPRSISTNLIQRHQIPRALSEKFSEAWRAGIPPPNNSTCLLPAELSLDPAQPTQVVHHQTPERQAKLDNLLPYYHSATIHVTEGAPCRVSGITAENIKLRTAFSSKFRPKKMNAAAEATTYNQVAMTAMIVCVSGAVG